ncbi:hypothetical protein OKW45_003452 [Paraburkholderia sp. WSM4175]
MQAAERVLFQMMQQHFGPLAPFIRERRSGDVEQRGVVGELVDLRQHEQRLPPGPDAVGVELGQHRQFFRVEFALFRGMHEQANIGLQPRGAQRFAVVFAADVGVESGCVEPAHSLMHAIAQAHCFAPVGDRERIAAQQLVEQAALAGDA